MASRRELKEQRRRERLEAERREVLAKRRSRRVRLAGAGLAALLLAGGVAGVLVAGDGNDPLEAFAAKPEGLAERVQQAGLEFGGDHFHPTVRVVAKGRTVPVPVEIGQGSGGAMIPIHMHAGDEKLHAEGLQEGAFTLQQFMRVWGVALDENRLGPYRADGSRKVTVFEKAAGAERFREVREFESLQLRDGQEVYVVYGTAEESPIAT